MKARALTLTLVALLTLPAPGLWAQSSRTHGIGDQPIAQAQQELAIIRHDLVRLNTALEETETTLREGKNQVRLWNMAAIGTASVGLGLAALAATATLSDGKIGVALISVQAALSAVTSYMQYHQAKFAPNLAVDRALLLARQEILAMRASGGHNAESLETLLQLDQSLGELQTALQDFDSKRTTHHRLRLAGIVSQSAGTAISLGVGLGALRISTSYGQILMASGHLAALIQGLTPAKTDLVITEIQQTRAAVQNALAGL